MNTLTVLSVLACLVALSQAVHDDAFFNLFPTQDEAYLRFSHSTPFPQPVDVFLDELEVPIWNWIPPKMITEYVPLMPGIHNITVVPASEHSTLQHFSSAAEGEGTPPLFRPFLSVEFNFASNSFHTFIWSTDESAFSAIPRGGVPFELIEDVHQSLNDSALLSFINFYPDSQSVDVLLLQNNETEGEPIFRDIPHRAASDYAVLQPGSYRLIIRPVGMEQETIDVMDLEILSGETYSLWGEGYIGARALLLPRFRSDAILKFDSFALLRVEKA